MDFKTLITPKDGLCAVAADALVLVLAGSELPTDIDPTLGAAIRGAIDAGDLTLKAGQALYLYRQAAGRRAGCGFQARCGHRRRCHAGA
jgi:hypothetical protein